MTTLDLHPHLHASEEFQKRLAEEVEQAGRDGGGYAIVACVPQHLPGEDVTDIVDAAADCLREFVRDVDLTGRLDDHVLAMGLVGANAAASEVLAHRLQSDLRIRSYRLRSTLWETGVASPPEGGLTAQELLASAIAAAGSRRRRLAD